MRRSWKALIVTAAVLLGTLGVMSLASASTDVTIQHPVSAAVSELTV